MRGQARAAASAALTLLLATGCDQTFHPIQESDRYFSVFGALDASADTQWIRVMPIRDSIFSATGPIDAVVTLESIGTGEVIVMRDSVFPYPSADPEIVETFYAHNFWTAADIHPGETYRFKATRSDGRSTTAEVPMPDEISRIVVGIGEPVINQDFVRVEGPRHIALLHALHHMPNQLTGGFNVQRVVQNMGLASSPGEGTSVVNNVKRYWPHTADPGSAFNPPLNMCVEVGAEKCELEVYASGSPWAFDPLFDDDAIGAPDVASNVVNGTGFLGGILRKTIPYEHCSKQQPPNFRERVYCELVYDDRSAGLSGSVRDIASGEPVSARVELWETAGENQRIILSDVGSGSYRFGALQSGTRYGYRLTKTDYETVEGVLEFTVGEARVMDFMLKKKPRSCTAC